MYRQEQISSSSHRPMSVSPAGRLVPEKFCPVRFRSCAQDLSKAVFELSRERMGATSDLRNHLGVDNVHVRFGDGRKFVTMNDQTVELPADASNEDVAKALNPTPMPSVDIVPAAPAPVPEKIQDSGPLSNITGLQSGAFQDALVKMRQKIAAKQMQAVGKIAGAVANAEAKMDAAADEVAAKVDKEISAALQEFAQHTNGGPV
jgi:hypothetical protein